MSSMWKGRRAKNYRVNIMPIYFYIKENTLHFEMNTFTEVDVNLPLKVT